MKKKQLRIPPILLEGDEPPPAARVSPTEKFALGPAAPPQSQSRRQPPLPPHYGTGKLLAIPRDPHWLYVHWDLTDAQQQGYNALSADHHLVVRVQAEGAPDHPLAEAHARPESRHWFVHLGAAGLRCVPELGYYGPGRQWVSVAVAPPIGMPRDAASVETQATFLTLQPAFAPMPSVAPPRPHVTPPAQKAGLPEPSPIAPLTPPASEWPEFPMPPLAPPWPFAAADCGIGEFGGQSIPEPSTPEWPLEPGPPPEPGEVYARVGPELPLPQWTSAQEQALAKLIGQSTSRRGSPASAEFLNPSSPSQAPALPPRPFWLDVNAELIVYGATEPDAALTVAGQPIRLRPDGTFSLRFALPDGEYHLLVTATAPHGDSRQVALRFVRSTAHPGQAPLGAYPAVPREPV